MTRLPFDPAGLQLDRAGGLSRQLYQALRARMLDGRLASGVRMPASRELASALRISRNSVMRAYDQLYAEGFIEGRVGDGTYVSPLALDAVKQSTKSSTGLSPGLSTGLSTDCPQKADAAGEVTLPALALPLPSAQPPKAFRVGVPAFDLFPFHTWSKLQAAYWRAPALADLGYQHPAGDRQLRELIAAYLRSSRGLYCDADQIVLTCGAQQAVALCAQILLQPGTCAAVENPGYRAAGLALANAGAQVQPVEVDAEGLCVEQLAALAGCQLAYVTPAHQYPTGVTMSLARRLALLEWAQRQNGWIIEDDYDGEYRYSGAPLAPLAALDRAGRVVYVGTFGKVAFPALRLGYLVLPPALVPAFVNASALAGRHLEVGTQKVMARFIADGHFQRHIRRMRKAALARRNALIEHWPQAVAGCAPLPRVSAGLHLSVEVANAAREAELVSRAAAAGVELNRLSAYRQGPAAPSRTGLVLGFASVNEGAIAEACKALQIAWRR
ncbi:aminotransferase class I/II-fold pyridoxal phosphate-dependent enzyme [Pseudomonas sp. NPDC007930]|uniref:MocR-like pyridoxine biosynthesis transcription factor PdxR n=1 Tax=Pseudomonas sp. NPDC007930 TaxID=3364417 RepID=UPI0036E0AE6B